jgi:hypothetical protein
VLAFAYIPFTGPDSWYTLALFHSVLLKRIQIIYVSNIYKWTLWQIADNWEALDSWLDALCLVYTIFARGKSDVLAGIITG